MTAVHDSSIVATPPADSGGVEEAVAALFRQTGQTVALAESCSGGLIAKRITDCPGSSAYFLLGAVVYANSAKQNLLGVPEDIIATYGAVSPETALAMATGVRTIAGSDLGLATTGIAGPDGGTAEKPVGLVYIAIAGRTGSEVHQYAFSGDRKTVREMTCRSAMALLYQQLVKERRDNRLPGGE